MAFSGTATEFLGISFSLAALGTWLGFKIRKHKHRSQIQIFPMMNGDSPGPDDPNDPDKRKRNSYKNNKRKENKISKSIFFENIKSDYQYWRDGIYKRKSKAKGIEGAEYLQWDYLHNDVEAYNSSKNHIGSIDPETSKFYKPPVNARKIK